LRSNPSPFSVPPPPAMLRAKALGFCMGVRRAVRLAHAEVDRSANKVYTLGALIHNPRVLDELERRGVETLDEAFLPGNLRGASVVIRAHGIRPQLEEELRARGAVIVDATCPRVKASQVKVQTLAEAGRVVFLAGEKSHAEVAGILGYAELGARRCGESGPPPCVVAGCADEARALAKELRRKNRAKTALVAQTTISQEEYSAIAEAILEFFPDLEIVQTICAATQERQDSLRELLGKVDAVIIAGGRESANTRRLLAIAEAAGKPCALAETACDIPLEFFGFETIGITAGASTPEEAVEDIERAFDVRPLGKP